MAFLVASQTIQRSLAQLSLLFGHYVRGISAGSRIFEVIVHWISSVVFIFQLFLWFSFAGQYSAIQPSIPLRGGKVIPFHSLFGQVEFKNVEFSYPTRKDQVRSFPFVVNRFHVLICRSI